MQVGDGKRDEPPLALQCGSVSGTEITDGRGGGQDPAGEAAMRLRLRDGDHSWLSPARWLGMSSLQCGSVSGTEITYRIKDNGNAQTLLQCGSVSGTEITGFCRMLATRALSCNAAPSQGRRSRPDT